MHHLRVLRQNTLNCPENYPIFCTTYFCIKKGTVLNIESLLNLRKNMQQKNLKDNIWKYKYIKSLNITDFYKSHYNFSKSPHTYVH